MMLKITERCTMNCQHCMNNANKDGKDIKLEVLQDCLMFLKDNGLAKENLVITGGEPTEHKDFDSILKEIFKFNEKFNHFNIISVTTNGENIQKEPERFKDYVKQAEKNNILLYFQVSADERYYPRRIQTHKRIFREEGFILVDDCIQQIYPQGRALENNIPWKSKCSKCFNVRALSHQLSNNATLRDIEMQLELKAKFCTPHIKIDGSIGLGESDLCPVCATIYDGMKTIMDKIRKFKCSNCDHINKDLPELYKALL